MEKEVEPERAQPLVLVSLLSLWLDEVAAVVSLELDNDPLVPSSLFA